MANNVLLAPHVVLLGEALQPLLRKVEAALSEPVRPIGADENFLDVCRSTLIQFRESVNRLADEANGTLNGVAGAADVPDAEVHRAVGRLEMVLDELLDSYAELREARPHTAHVRGQELLLAALRQTLTEIQDWLLDMVDAFADPVEALKRKGLPTDGSANLQLIFKITTPKELEEFNDWADEQVLELEEINDWMGEQEQALLEGRSVENQERKPGCWNGLTAFVAGMFLGGWFLGDDE